MTELKRIYIDGAVGTGQSVGSSPQPTNKPPSVNIGDMSPPGPNPAAKLDAPNPDAAHGILTYPEDRPPYYMTISVNNYSRESWRAVGKLQETNRIIIPLPNQMIDNHNVRYELTDIGIAGAVGFDTISGQLSQAAAEATAGAAKGALSAIRGKTGAAGVVAGKAFNGVLGAVGLAVNDFMTVMLKGPDYKRRDFVWRFSPKSAKETDTLKKIIRLLNNSMAPSLAGVGSAFFSWPKIFKPEFTHDIVDLGLNTFKMKPSVITDFSINYTPNNVYSPFGSTKAPTSVEIHITFLELEFWLSGDFDENPTEDTLKHNLKGKSSSTLINAIIDPVDAVSEFNKKYGTPGGLNTGGVGGG